MILEEGWAAGPGRVACRVVRYAGDSVTVTPGRVSACNLERMWRGRDGRLHTVALPDPGEVYTDAALAALKQLVAQTDFEDMVELVERHELAAAEYWDSRPVDDGVEASFAEVAPPIGLFDRVVASLPELDAAVAAVDPRWGLDVVTALDDLVGSD